MTDKYWKDEMDSYMGSKHLYKMCGTTPESQFFYACYMKEWDDARWFINKYSFIDFPQEERIIQLYNSVTRGERSGTRRKIFEEMCKAGELDLAKHIHKSVYMDISFTEMHDYTDAIMNGFRYACENGKLEMAKWVHTLRNNENDIITNARNNGHQHVVDWLKEIY